MAEKTKINKLPNRGESELIDGLGCCGNCKYSDFMDSGNYYLSLCRKLDIGVAGNHWCKKWESDKLTLADREETT